MYLHQISQTFELQNFNVLPFSVVLLLVIILILTYRCLSTNDNYLGPLAKVSHLLGFQLHSLERRRWNFFPHQHSTKSRFLIVSFGGGAMKIGGVPCLEFKRSLAQFECDQLFIMDPTGMTWYLQDPTSNWRGYEYYEQRLKDTIKNYEKTMFIGNCLGGSGALMFSHLANKVVVLSPNVDPHHHKDFFVHLGAWLLPEQMKGGVYNWIKQNTSKSQASIHVYSSNSDQGKQQTSLLPSNVKVTLYDCLSVSGYLKKQGQLVPLLKDHFEDMLAQTENL